jgi:protein required for attachment to host cells
MRRHPVTWIVIADGGRARIVIRRGSRSHYATLREIVSASTHSPSHNLGADRPGRAHESATTARHAMEPRTDPHEQAKLEFAREIAAVLNETGASNEFDRIVLVAQPQVAAALRARLAETVRRKIVGEIPKDLTKVPDHQLASHFEEIERVL